MQTSMLNSFNPNTRRKGIVNRYRRVLWKLSMRSVTYILIPPIFLILLLLFPKNLEEICLVVTIILLFNIRIMKT